MDALILACSATKKLDPFTMPTTTDPVWGDDDDGIKAPAVLVYDGPLWRIVRRWNPTLHVFALSGKYGLFDARHPIPSYDRRLLYPTEDWIRSRVIFGAGPCLSLWDRYEVVWYCVPSGGYKRVIEALIDAVGDRARLRPVTDLLGSEDLSLPLYFARTRSLSRLCKQHSRGRMKVPATIGEWAAMALAGEILA